jgi:HTH-type transcriptional regulator, sugar sensing transcriptional regulator
MNQESIISSLVKYGLSENEAKIYCATLALEDSTVDKIAKYADLNRTSSYPVLERLKNLGLVSQSKKRKKTIYKAVPPEKFFDLLDEKKEIVSSILPDLKSLFAISRGQPDVSFFEGKEGLKTVLNDVLNEAKEVCILGDGENFINTIPGWTEAYVSKRAGKKIKVKLILKASPYGIKSIKKLLESSQYNQLLKVRMLPEIYRINYSGFDIYNKKVVFYSFEKFNHAVVVESSVINQLMRTVFDILWETSEKYNYLLK